MELEYNNIEIEIKDNKRTRFKKYKKSNEKQVRGILNLEKYWIIFQVEV